LASRYGLQIRAATGADAPGLAALLESAGHPIPPAALAARVEACHTGSGTVLLALEWGPPSGVIALSWFRTLESDFAVAQITTLLVGPDERRRGIGRLLLKAAAQAARVAGCGTLTIAADTVEAATQAFCAGTGFEPSGPAFARNLRKRS
jgi:aminoglycoside 6'-N-acetyltransferase I